VARGCAGRGITPPILTLVGLFDEHPQAFAYDWRTRFGVSVTDVGTRAAMTWGEAWHLAGALAGDPSSHVAAAVAGWTHPTDRPAMVLADLYDLLHRVHAKVPPKPYPRPWSTSESKRTTKPSIPQDLIREALRRRRPEKEGSPDV